MKRIISTMVFLAMVLAVQSSLVQAQSTEFTYQGSLKDGANAATGNSVAQASETFDLAWQTIVKGLVTVEAAPQMTSPAAEDGWEALSGFAPFEKDGAKGVAELYTTSGYGKMVNALVLTNTEAYEPAIAAVLESISLKKLGTSAKPQTESNAENSAIVRQWGMSVSGQRNFETNHGLSGYITRQYTFNPNGTYLFVIKTFSYVFIMKTILLNPFGKLQ